MSRRAAPAPAALHLTQKETPTSADRPWPAWRWRHLLRGTGLLFKEPAPPPPTTYPRPHAPHLCHCSAHPTTRRRKSNSGRYRMPPPPTRPASRCAARSGMTAWWMETPSAQGEKIRIADIDTPEISRHGAMRNAPSASAPLRALLELLNQGPFELVQPGWPCRDRYGRALRHVARDGVSIGDRLVTEGLARKWEGRREPCVDAVPKIATPKTRSDLPLKHATGSCARTGPTAP